MTEHKLVFTVFWNWTLIYRCQSVGWHIPEQ